MPIECWFADHDKPEPQKVTCETFGYPNRDDDGRTMYNNTHFLKEEDAWRCLHDNALAGVKLAGANVVQARETLARVEVQAAAAAAHYSQVVDYSFRRERERQDR